ncbi:subtilisin-like protease SBT2.5 isoform X2 [Hordeum vulgare subsp. vulgare]|uniref:subtilisin-like protease SBT2.5 isoform X2 n=1 Tax=Hordeum vulgare subsp. vulgare TaxID=112509 RepID=UPI001D1A53BB|nr:subtilisin-like protease SBT2.5 isoform X2 [Hordeum vulgare subsp. vulgare]
MYSTLDCQRPELLNKRKVQGKILLCGYSFNYISGTASIKKVSQTAKSLGAAGFVVAVEDSYPGTKFDHVPVNIPEILITNVSKIKDLIDYYNSSTTRDWAGRATTFQATVGIADGLAPTLFNSAPEVALFSSRGLDVKYFSFQDVDVLKPDILAPGNLIWSAWAPNGIDEANYAGYASAKNDFLFKRRLQSFIFDILMQHSRGKSALIFCSTRKGAQEAAQCLSQTTGSLGYSNPFMKSMQHWFHNGGLCLKDRRLVEGLFLKGDLQILCMTNTLARHQLTFTYSSDEVDTIFQQREGILCRI